LRGRAAVHDTGHREEALEKGIRIKNRFQTAQVDCRDICYIEQIGRKIIVHTDYGEYWERCSMESMLMRLDERVFRVHHSLAVNLDEIRSVSRGSVELLDGCTLMMCREAAGRAKKAWLERVSKP
jgi:DNA-binding LytR/AlgR family response regulator